MLDIRDAVSTPQYTIKEKIAAFKGFFFLILPPANLEDLYNY